MKRKGFTLIELIVAMIIVTILASIVTPQLLKNAEKSRQAEAVEILMRMYKGYKAAKIDEVLVLCPGQNYYNFFNYSCTGNDRRMFNPDESDIEPDEPDGRSDLSWKTLGFEKNPNNETNRLFFSYDFLKPYTGSGLPPDDSLSTGPTSTGRGGGGSGIRPNKGNSIYDGMNMGVAWRKTGGYDNGYQLYNVNSSKYIFIDMDTGKIYKSQTYQ